MHEKDLDLARFATIEEDARAALYHGRKLTRIRDLGTDKRLKPVGPPPVAPPRRKKAAAG